MPKFDANLSMMFNEVPFLERFERAARAGFRGVEFLFPYDHAKAEIRAALAANGLELVLHNMPPGNWAGGERGLGCLPGREAEFRAGVATALDYATFLGLPRIHCMAGICPADLPRDVALRTLVDNFRYAARECRAAGLTLLVEPINDRDIPGYCLNTSADGIAVLDAVGEDNVRLQYDVYHMQIMEGDLAPTFEALLPRIGHVQIADTPGRHEPGTGEIHYPFLFTHFDRSGYAGWVGCEYRPAAVTEDGLGWATPWLRG
ncbi:MAG: hydroxypyruvate isomerase [Burkholderiales bacterium]|jgi:hydroxypyruvate isomerase|nr:hydroxypyruvate isomerase [Burkholderiales bacterium]